MEHEVVVAAEGLILLGAFIVLIGQVMGMLLLYLFVKAQTPTQVEVVRSEFRWPDDWTPPEETAISDYSRSRKDR